MTDFWMLLMSLKISVYCQLIYTCHTNYIHNTHIYTSVCYLNCVILICVNCTNTTNAWWWFYMLFCDNILKRRWMKNINVSTNLSCCKVFMNANFFFFLHFRQRIQLTITKRNSTTSKEKQGNANLWWKNSSKPVVVN